MLKTYISHGSVATQLRSCGIFHNHVIAIFSQSVSVKEFQNQPISSEDMDKTLRHVFFCSQCNNKHIVMCALCTFTNLSV